MRFLVALLTFALVACTSAADAPPDASTPSDTSTDGAPTVDAAVAPDVTPASTRKKIVVIAGQSNAAGRADWHDVTTLLDANAPYPNVTIAQQLADEADPLPWTVYATGALAPRPGPSSLDMGIELSLGRDLDAANPQGWALVKFAVGSSSLHEHWRVGSKYPSRPAGTPDLLDQFMAFLAAQTIALDGDIVAIAWIQGEADSRVQLDADAYAGDMSDLTAAVRAVYPGVPIVFNQLNAQLTALGLAYVDDVRAQQAQYLQMTPGAIEITDDDLALQLNQPHYTADSYVALGHRFATAILALP